MDNTYSSACFKKAKQLLLILKAETEDKYIKDVLVFGYGEQADMLEDLLKGSRYNVCRVPDINGQTFDAVILLEYINEEELIKLTNKDAYVIDAVMYDDNKENFYFPSHYQKIRVIALSEI